MIVACLMLLFVSSLCVAAETGSYVDVSSSDQLAQALLEGKSNIRITGDIEVDRTFYIVGDTIIFSEKKVVLKRADDFAGDFFVVGEDSNGNVSDREGGAVLTLGSVNSDVTDLLVLDGNKDGVSVDVTGSAIFVCNSATVNMYNNLTITDFKKDSNVRALEEKHGMSYTDRIGGSGIILAKNSTVNIYGGTYSNNQANDILEAGESSSPSFQGGFAYNFGTLNIYGGTFDSNKAARGGFVYNYRSLNIYAAEIKNNTATNLGGAVYMANSTASIANIGQNDETDKVSVFFTENNSASHGGAIYARNKINIKNTTFDSNKSDGAGGAIAAYTTVMTIDNCDFKLNRAETHGSAVYMSGSNEKESLEITVTDSGFKQNTADQYGTLYITDGARAYMENCEFSLNMASHGGAIYSKGSQVEINGSVMTQNEASSYGGGIALYDSSVAKLNNITANNNFSTSRGGFLYTEGSVLDMYNSTVSSNVSDGMGGAMVFYTGSASNVYNTVFEKNTSKANGGAVVLYTGAYNTVLHSCKFFENTAGGYGGGVYASGKSLSDMYNITATDNTAGKGGWLYQTTTGTTINISGIQLSGNNATDGGPFIWGNSTGAKLNIDKSKYIDHDFLGDWDDVYWSAVIYNSLKVNEVTLDVPDYVDYDGTTVSVTVPTISSNVVSAAQLERALSSGLNKICIADSFEIDRTFYITRDTTIYSVGSEVLTRAADFAGDFFVVGEDKDGNAVESEEKIVLTLGDSSSSETNLLVLDGNKDNMTVEVTGSAVFVCSNGRFDAYSNLTVQNFKKVGNVKALEEKHGMSYTSRIGGAGIVIAKSAEVNIYGGIYKNNETNDIVDSAEDTTPSFHGGFIYNFGTLNIYGGVFEQNHASRGSVIYNYRKANIYAADITNNTSSSFGGAIYMPNSTGAVLNIGDENDVVTPKVLFDGNTAGDDGGAIYARNKVYIKNTTFSGNHSSGYGGAIVANTTAMTVSDTSFESNNSASHGGAIYFSGAEGDLNMTKTAFRKNVSDKNGGAIYINSSAKIYGKNIEFSSNSASSGGAVYNTGASVEIDGSVMNENIASVYGGALSLNTTSTTVLNAIEADGNQSTRGGFAYIASAHLDMYNSDIKNSVSSGNGGAIAFYQGSSANVYSTDFTSNSAVSNGGAIIAYTDGGKVVLHTCTFKDNVSNGVGGVMYASEKALVDIYSVTATGNSATKGGFFYETTTGTVINLVGATVSGNVATDAAPIIWGNSTGAKLNIDKSKYKDLDQTGELGSDYWSQAIVNKLNVTEISEEVPKYLDYGNESYDHMSDAVDVSSSEELEQAILAGNKHIRVVSDFEIDRTFFIANDVTIFSTAPYTLTRASDFGGDIFVVGEDSNGNSCILLGTDPTLTLGNPLSEKENLLVIDGNKDNMSVTVNGTVIFITSGANADLHKNVSVINCYKASNERTYDSKYRLSRPNRIGGPVAIVENGIINFYGGNYKYNKVRDEIISEDDEEDAGRDSTLGGVIYNNSNVAIYGGNFEGNYGARGGVIYNYKIVTASGASFVDNYASVSGGVFYMPNAAAAHMLLGSENEDVQTLFKGNKAKSHGGVIYSSTLCALVVYGNTTFEENQAVSGSGGAVCVYGQFTARDTVFKGNSATLRGGAVFTSRSSDEHDTRHTTFENCSFEENCALTGGAICVYASSNDYDSGAIVFATNTNFIRNYSQKSETSSGAGGAVYLDRNSHLTAEGCQFAENHSDGEAGAIYATNKSQVKTTDTSFENNYTNAETGSHGGALSIRSSNFVGENVSFTGNSARTNGGAIYVSYISSADVNSTITLKDSSFTANKSDSYGGSIYATRQNIDGVTDKRIINVYGTDFKDNTAKKSAGVIYIASKVEALFKNSTFTSNIAEGEEGGVLYTVSGIATFEECSFTENKATTTGGAISAPGNAKITLYKPIASGNQSGGYGGFVYTDNASLNVFGGTVDSNTSGSAGGAMAFFGTATTNIYDTEFTSNTAETNGGALFIYTESTNTCLHSNTFISNTAANYGGAIEMSKVSLVDIYDIVGKDNSAKNGGFIYETSAGTTVKLVGATVSGNTASVGGPIIWGNTLNADLYIDKNKFTDLDTESPLDDAYWEQAIVNKLTVIDYEGVVPEKEEYTPDGEDDEDDIVIKDPVPVTDVLSLGISSSDGYINKVYDALPKLDNSSNFMSKGTIVYPDINGTDVTVDTFVYPEYGTADNVNVGQGILIYQAILYKQAHPDEDVYIDVASYRFSIEAAVNINRNSRYFGYMRNLVGQDYDEFGFVRISYLLVTAAKMGIHVNVTGHIDGYPISSVDPDLSQYFTNQLNDPCDPAYAEGKVIGDYMDFTHCQWPLGSKGGTDMMHTKMCAVSHYIDMNGKEHRNAVFSSSANLDGIRSDAANGNWKLQSGSIISDHEEMYRTAVNYLRLVLKYGKQQEGIYELQQLVNNRSTQQIDLQLAGKADEIAKDEQIVYIGTENDPVFELYFTPFGGGILEWNEKYNPYCKYLRKLYNSEDYIIFTWNAAEYNSGFALGLQMEDVIVGAFHNNKNPNNRFYGVMDSFDGTRMSDLVIGEDIGYVSVNERPFGYVHNKDVQVSYTENGKRQYVTLLNSLNLHSGSMYYQSNFLIVVKEPELKENGVFFTLADNSTLGIVEHSYGEEKSYYPSETEDGYTYIECVECGRKIVTGTAHHEGDWINHGEGKDGFDVQKKLCLVCGEILEVREYCAQEGSESITEYKNEKPQKFSADYSSYMRFGLEKTPYTIEAKIKLPKAITSRGGVILGNYLTKQDNQLNLEIYYNGRVRLYYVNGYYYENCIFDPDIRSDKPVHIAVTVEGKTANLYIDGVLADTKAITVSMPESLDDILIGTDNRDGNPQYFKGTIYSVSLFDDVRTSVEIVRDAIFVNPDAEGVLYTHTFADKDTGKLSDLDYLGRTFDEELVLMDSVNSKAPKTIEARVQLPMSVTGRGGVIVGNYEGTSHKNQLNLEIYNEGKVRLYYMRNWVGESCLFNTDIRSDAYVDIAVSVDGQIATLFVNGKAVEQAELTVTYPETISDWKAGGDNRPGNPQFFKGKIAYIHLFSDVRDEQQIAKDLILVDSTDKNLLLSYYFVKGRTVNNIKEHSGQTFNQETLVSIDSRNISTPRTFEAYINLPKTYSGRGGVVLGNYDGVSPNQINLEIYDGGRVRLFYMNNWQKSDCLFDTDIRSNKVVHIAVTVEDNVAALYVDGVKVETKELKLKLPQTTLNIKVGGDNRLGNPQYFKGTIYSVALYDYARSYEQILQDMTLRYTIDTGRIFDGIFVPAKDGDSSTDSVKFTELNKITVSDLSNTPHTVEAWVRVPLSQSGRAGVLFGNYDNSSKDQMNIEVYNEGKLRLFYITDGVRYNHYFSKDIRSNEKTHISVTVNENVASLYVNGMLEETVTLTTPYTNAKENFVIGGDNRVGNLQYFKGEVYSVSLFEDTRSGEEILGDMVKVSPETEGFMYMLEVADEVCPNGDGIIGHNRDNWVTDITPTAGGHGIYHNVCDLCGKILSYKSVYSSEILGDVIDYKTLGMRFDTYTDIISIKEPLEATPKTFEVMLNLPTDFNERGGVLTGNYTSSGRDVINLEIYNNGAPRLYFRNNYAASSVLFTTDIRSEGKTHIAVTAEGSTAKLYVNGVLVETAQITGTLPNVTDGFCVGGDARTIGYQNFKGTIYSVHMFSDVRSDEEIMMDAVMINDDDNMIYSAFLTK